jgi:hypothetical protein
MIRRRKRRREDDAAVPVPVVEKTDELATPLDKYVC